MLHCSKIWTPMTAPRVMGRNRCRDSPLRGNGLLAASCIDHKALPAVRLLWSILAGRLVHVLTTASGTLAPSTAVQHFRRLYSGKRDLRGRSPLPLRYWRRSRLRQTDVAQGDPGAVLAPTRTRYDQHVREIVRKRALLVAMFAAVWILPARSATTQLQARWRSRHLPLTTRRRSMQARQSREPRSGLISTS